MIDLEARACALNERAVSEAPPVELILARGRRYRVRGRLAAAAVGAVVVAAVVIAVALVGKGSDRGVQTVDSTPSTVAQLSPVARAARLADVLLAQARLPGGATRYAGPLSGGLTGPFEREATPNLVDVDRLWIVHAPSDQVLNFVRTHTPPGMTVEACCAYSMTGDHVTVQTVVFSDADGGLPASEIAVAQLEVSVERRSATTTWVRADAQAVWRADRDPTERVPARDRVVVITRQSAITPDPSRAPHRVVVTQPAAVDRLEAAFNAINVAVPALSSCPQVSTYVVSFSATLSSTPDVVATLRCGTDAGVTVNGHAAATLEAGALETQVAARFGG